jgi:hypothetical protein
LKKCANGLRRAVTEHTIEVLASELDDCCARVHKAREKMRKLRPGSEAYVNSLTDLSIVAFETHLKAQSVTEAVDEFHDTLPD